MDRAKESHTVVRIKSDARGWLGFTGTSIYGTSGEWPSSYRSLRIPKVPSCSVATVYNRHQQFMTTL